MEKNDNGEGEKQGKWNIKPYLAVGLVVLVVLICAVTYYFAVLRYHGLSDFGAKTMSILQPIIFGIIIAYLVNPIVKWEEKMLVRISKKNTIDLKTKRMFRTISIFGALLLVIFLVGILLRLIIVRRRITIGCNSKLKSRLTPIRPRGLACNCTFLSA